MNEDDLKHIEAIIRSMTPEERHSPEIIDSSRRRRIAKGSGTTTQEVNALLNQFKQMQKMMKMLTGGGGPNRKAWAKARSRMMRNMRGMMK